MPINSGTFDEGLSIIIKATIQTPSIIKDKISCPKVYFQCNLNL